MTLKRHTPLAVLAGLLAGALSAGAAIVANPVSGDLFLGFRASGGQGAASSYLVNLGQDTVFRNATPGSAFSVAIPGNIGADLTALFGADWSTRADLFWGVAGVRASQSSIVYGSRERVTPETVSLPWPELDATARNGTAGAITTVLETTGGYRGSESTANSPVAVIQPNSTSDSSYSKQVATQGVTDFGTLSQWGGIEGDFGGGAGNTVLDLYRVAGSGVTSPGSFRINSQGTVTFTAVPEPSVVFLTGMTAAAALLRRKR